SFREAFPTNGHPNPVHCIMAGTPSPQLYHYHIDPGENANVALQYPHKVGELSKLMDNQHAENES
ncbi:MAG: hypothetical protein WC112_08595, partial [Proteiniphilum sp.]